MTGITNNNRINLEAIIDLMAYTRQHGLAIEDHEEASRAQNYIMGMLDALQFAGKKAARAEAWRHFQVCAERYRDDFERNPPGRLSA